MSVERDYLTMKKKTIFLLWLFLLLPGTAIMVANPVHSPESEDKPPIHIVSRVVDSRTGEYLPFASVYINGHNSTITNAEGEFVIDADSTDMLRFSYVGYLTAYVPAKSIGNVVKLKTQGKMLDEVVVFGTDYIIQKVMERQKKEYKNHKRKKSNFFYRQVGYTDRQCNSFLEAFFSARVAYQLSDLSLVTGRYVAVASLRTINPANFFTFAEVPIFSSEKNIPLSNQLVPLHRGYDRAYKTDKEVISDGERKIYVLYFVPRNSKRWAITCRIYVDAETFQVLKYEGVGDGEMVIHMVKKRGVVCPISHSFVIDFQHENGFTEVRSVHFETKYEADNHTFKTTGILFNVADRYVKGKKSLHFDDNLMNIIGTHGLDKDFWQKNEIVKRTPIEEEAIEIFERDNLFGVY